MSLPEPVSWVAPTPNRGANLCYVMAAKTRVLVLVSFLLSFSLLASSCGSSNDPKTWAEAGVEGNVQTNFYRACTEANQDGSEFSLSDSQVRVLCECSFEKLVSYYGGTLGDDGVLTDASTPGAGGGFSDFAQLDKDLRNDPSIIPASVEAFLTSCGALAAGTSGS
jgi:hypothetical protein